MKKKSILYIYKIVFVIECGKKRCSNIFYWVKKKNLFGCFRIDEIRDIDNETGLKKERVIEIENYSAFHIRDARFLFRFLIYLPSSSSSSSASSTVSFLAGWSHGLASARAALFLRRAAAFRKASWSNVSSQTARY
jgi:hypothetical protein